MPEERSIRCRSDTQSTAPPDRTIAALAARQHGVVARWQLGALGVSDTVVSNRARRGLLIPLHRGVYAVGHERLRREGRWLAAVLAVGPGAVLSHRDAAALHEIRPSNRAAVDVAVDAKRVAPAGVSVHRQSLTPADVIVAHAIPVTTVARTLVDLAGMIAPNHLARALGEAERRRHLDVRAIEDALRRTAGRRGRGHAAMRAALAEHSARGARHTRSDLEERFLALLDTCELPRPRTNAYVDGHEVDALWPVHRLAVELDGWAFHRHRTAFQNDRTKSNALIAAGWTVLRFTHDDVVRRPRETAAAIAPWLSGGPVSPAACGAARPPRRAGRRAS